MQVTASGWLKQLFFEKEEMPVCKIFLVFVPLKITSSLCYGTYQSTSLIFPRIHFTMFVQTFYDKLIWTN